MNPTLPQTIIDAFEEERGRIDGYKGPLFRAVDEIVSCETCHGRRKQNRLIKRDGWSEMVVIDCPECRPAQ